MPGRIARPSHHGHPEPRPPVRRMTTTSAGSAVIILIAILVVNFVRLTPKQISVQPIEIIDPDGDACRGSPESGDSVR